MKRKSIRDIKIKTKLLLLGGVSILGLVFIGAESIITARQINEASTEISQSWVPAIIIAEELNTETSDYRNKEYYHVISQDSETMNHLEKEMASVRKDIDAAFEEYENYISHKDETTDRQLMENARSYWNRYLEYSDRLLQISRQNETEKAREMIIGESRQLFDDASTMFLKVAEFNRQGAEAASIHGDRLYERLAKVKIISICLIASIITLLVIYIIMAIDKPVKAIVEGTRRVANGDLDVYLPYQSEDEVGILTESVNQLIDRLKNIIDDEKYLFQEIGSENFEVKSTCEQAYRGDFAPILYSIASLMSRLEVAKRKKEECRKLKEAVERESANRENRNRENVNQESADRENPTRKDGDQKSADRKDSGRKEDKKGDSTSTVPVPGADMAGGVISERSGKPGQGKGSRWLKAPHEETEENGSREMDASYEEGRF